MIIFNSEKIDFSMQDINIQKTEDGSYCFSIKIYPVAIYSKNNINSKNILTKREKEVLKLMAKGENNIKIAEELSVSVNTIKAHISKIFEKLKVNDRVQAVVKGIYENIIDIWLQKRRYVVKLTYRY